LDYCAEAGFLLCIFPINEIFSQDPITDVDVLCFILLLMLSRMQ
jgi:hypothetical protein